MRPPRTSTPWGATTRFSAAEATTVSGAARAGTRSLATPIFGDAGNDWVVGGADNDTLYGGAGADALNGGLGDDTLTGGADADTFYFNGAFGTDTITDFTDGEDTIDLTAMTDITGFGDLTISADGTDAVIDLTSQGGGTIRLESFDVNDLDADDFNFYDSSTQEPEIEGI